MTKPKPMTLWQAENTPDVLPLHIRRNIAPGPDGCHLWTRSCDPDGYGWASLANHTYQAHRLVYTLVVGPVPSGLVLDHTCRVRHCVRVAHLEPVTNRENLARGDTPTGWDRCQRCGSEFGSVGVKIRQRCCLSCRAAYNKTRRVA